MQDVGASTRAGQVGGAVVLVEGMDDHHGASLLIKARSRKCVWVWREIEGNCTTYERVGRQCLRCDAPTVVPESCVPSQS